MNRRTFLLTGSGIAGTLMLGWAVTPPPPRLQLDTGSLPLERTEVQLNGWLKISAAGQVTIAIPRSEMGQGVYTALPMLLAEELGADWDMVKVEQSPVDQMYANVSLLIDALPFNPDDRGPVRENAEWIVGKIGRKVAPMLTGGSSSVKDGWHAMRVAGASAREMLVTVAARRFGVPASECSVAKSMVTHPSGLKANFGQLAAEAAQVVPNLVPRLKDPKDFTLIGKSIARTDVPAKVTGSAQFGLDVRLPDMLYASIRMAPTFGGTWEKWVSGIAETMPGVRAVLPLAPTLAGAPHGVAVLADQWWQAESALAALEPHITWENGPHSGLDSATIEAQFKAALAGGHADKFYSRGALAEGFGQAARSVEVEYRVPYLAHATMEPQNCTARLAGDKLEVWSGTQSPALARWIAAKTAGVQEQDVTVHTPYLGGGFGRRIEIDLVVQAVMLAMQMPGRAVQLIWPREQDTQHDVYRPAAAAYFHAGLDGNGNITAWHHKLACGSVADSLVGRMGLIFMGTDTLPQRLTLMMKSTGMPDKNNAEGAADVPYDFPNQRVEAFIDELAAAASKDPYQFRRNLLKNRPRHLAVLDLAATKAGWDRPSQAGMARGISLHESFGSIVAQVAEVSIVKDDKGQRPRVHRVVCAIDCGLAVNPSIIAQQMESGVVFGLTAALYGEITIKAGRVEQANFDSYNMLRMNEAPLVETHIVPSSAPPAGVGEPATPGIAPAVCNALFALTKKPIRALPIRL